jgi:hypothetical protein
MALCLFIGLPSYEHTRTHFVIHQAAAVALCLTPSRKRGFASRKRGFAHCSAN